MSDEPRDVTDGATDGATGEATDDDMVVYDMSEWEPDQIDTLEWALGRDGVPTVILDRELTIRAVDEARVDYLIDHLFDEVAGVELPPADDDGDADIDDIEALGALFVAADRLTHQAEDEVVRAELEEAATAVDRAPLPYGFEPAVWARIQTMTAWLVDELDGAEPELVQAHAGTLRDLLRQYI